MGAEIDQQTFYNTLTHSSTIYTLRKIYHIILSPSGKTQYTKFDMFYFYHLEVKDQK